MSAVPKHMPTPLEKKALRWHPFDPAKGYRQKRPLERRYVLLAFDYDHPTDWHEPAHCAVGYLKYSGGEKSRPFFVTPKVGGIPTHWCDCLGDAFWMPHWPSGQWNGWDDHYAKMRAARATVNGGKG